MTGLSLWRVLCVSWLAAITILAAGGPSQAQFARVGWTPVVSTQSGECLDVQSASTQSGAILIQSACQSKQSQQWSLEPNATGFVIVQKQSMLCMVASGNAVVQAACGGAGDTWALTAAGNAFQLMSTTSKLCLTPLAGSKAAGTTMSLVACTDATVTTWVFQSGVVMPNQLMTFQANNSGQCMMIGPSYIVQNPCAGTSFEQWRLVPSGRLYQYKIVLATSPYCLNTSSAAIGASLSTSTCDATADNQVFTLIPATTGYMIAVPFSSLCLDVNGASTAPATAIVLAACTGNADERWSVAVASTPSSWTGVIPLTNDPMAVANLPDGTLLTWSSSNPYQFEADVGAAPAQTTYSVFTPTTQASAPNRTDTGSADMFCPGTANLSDGRILVNGGSSSPKTTIYNPATHLFSSDANMNIPRGYEGDTPLSNGSVLTLGGSWSGGIGGKNGEIWTAGQGWTKIPNVPIDPFLSTDIAPNFDDNHLWLFALPNGGVFHAGPGSQMHVISTWGPGSVMSAGTRGDDAYSINGNAVMYDKAKILKVGGAPLYSGAAASPSAYTIDISAGVNVTKMAPMVYPRAFSNSVVLPNGQVLVVGGQTYATTFSDANAVLVPELWDPMSGVFQQLAPMQTARTYHSTAILLNDGRVFVGGGWQCGYNCTPDHFNAEIMSPPYLLNSDGSAATRPVVTGVPATAAPGSTISVTADSPIVSFALMRNSSVTHSVNNDQRRIPLNIQSSQPSGAGGTYTLQIPVETGTVVPGYYMLFALNAYGVPSVSASILVH